MILLWGSMEDEPIALARAALERAGADFFFLDHGRIFASEVDCGTGGGGRGRCTVTDGAATIDLGSVRAAYMRVPSFLDYEEMQGRAPGDPMAARAAGFELQLMAWLDASDALVINRSDPSATNNSKPHQLTLIRAAGLSIPETFISNDPAAARRFLAANPDSIYKSISGVRSIVRRVSDSHHGFMDDVAWCPTLFQRVVPGINHRVHVVGDEVLAVRIESDQLDYRYHENRPRLLGRPRHVRHRQVAPRNLRRGDHHLRGRHRPGGGAEGPFPEGAPDGRVEALHARPGRGVRPRLHLPDDPRQRGLRGPVPPRHVHRAAADRQGPGRDRAAGEGRRGGPRRDRQGQRPVPLRAHLHGARARTCRSSRPWKIDAFRRSSRAGPR
jgi:hypothetical protein